MKAAGISGLLARKRRRTTVRLPGVRVAPDLVERDFRPNGPNQTWSADITYISTWEGFLYLAHVQDLFSRLIVGWSMADHLRDCGSGTNTGGHSFAIRDSPSCRGGKDVGRAVRPPQCRGPAARRAARLPCRAGARGHECVGRVVLGLYWWLI